jgi:hypothetical protein
MEERSRQALDDDCANSRIWLSGVGIVVYFSTQFVVQTEHCGVISMNQRENRLHPRFPGTVDHRPLESKANFLLRSYPTLTARVRQSQEVASSGCGAQTTTPTRAVPANAPIAKAVPRARCQGKNRELRIPLPRSMPARGGNKETLFVVQYRLGPDRGGSTATLGDANPCVTSCAQ